MGKSNWIKRRQCFRRDSCIGWVEHGGYYYYTKPVKPNQKPEAALTKEMKLKVNCDGADGGHQAIDVMAEAIQSTPAKAVKEAWGVDPETLSQGGAGK